MRFLRSLAASRSAKRRPTEEQADAEMVEKLSTARQDLHKPRGARAVPFEEGAEAAEAQSEPKRKRAPRQLELRQHDFDPAAGGRRPRLDGQLRHVQESPEIRLALQGLGLPYCGMQSSHRGQAR